ncbi:LOW QUALITY PROTEIN: menin-like [Pollicipes pollicipes]|uniref:LOW QUALITY PROTEIN: menin-like n=1 Tax=Pollicipes pollicipes TaxID=41117 RepID=UPI001884ACD5|nr:LOW QUALITY PROTEIN: menin-like [Pollicipes pollicipes]
MRRVLSQEQQALFPLRSVADAARLFALELDKRRPSLDADAPSDVTDEYVGDPDSVPLPPLEYDTVFALHAKFCALVLDAVDLEAFDRGAGTPRALVKRVSDVIWFSLARSYHKDKPHIQSIYSFLTGNRLDCLGVAVAVVAACQLLGLDDVQLALSEDHAWVVFGRDGSETAEVTWHGKGNEDKRGQPISASSGRSWLYLNGSAVVCTAHMQVAAVVTSISPSISGAADSMELSLLQQRLLWLLYDRGAIAAYPMAIGNLAELEEASPTPDRPKPLELLHEAVTVARERYGNRHVYPYTTLGDYYYKGKQYEKALETWANASEALKHYDYSRDDEEVYKELMEITIDKIPHIIKEVGSGISAHSLLREPHCYLHLLRFYDGLCQWEQGSSTPVLHIGWAKQMVGCVSKFDPEVRRRVAVDVAAAEPPASNGSSKEKMAGLRDLLTSERFNPQAVSLQLTAQSQVSSKRRDDEDGRRPKRQRREAAPAAE